jgi:hypothetical protein
MVDSLLIDEMGELPSGPMQADSDMGWIEAEGIGNFRVRQTLHAA